MERKIVTAAEAARQIGCCSQMVRERMKNGEWPIGTVPRKKNGHYIVYQYLLDALLRGELMKGGKAV